MNPIDHGQLLIHVIFSTKNQSLWIDEHIEPFLYDRISKILYDDCYSPALQIGGGAEHVHILFVQSRDRSIESIVNLVKSKTSNFIRKWISDFDWQESYLAVSVSRMSDAIEKDYIARQKQIHEMLSFKDEFVDFLTQHEIEYDETDLWD